MGGILSYMMAAFSQAFMFLASLLCLLIGGAVLLNTLYWKLRAERVEATVIGVRQKTSRFENNKQNVYYTVYSYSFPDGTMVETTSRNGSSLTGGRETGKSVSLLVFRDDPHQVREAGGVAGYIFSTLFIAPGLWLLHTALTAYPVTLFTFAALLFFALYSLAKIRKIIIPKGQRKSIPAWKAARRAEWQKQWEEKPVMRIEDVMSSGAFRAELSARRASYPFLMPLCFAGALASFGGAAYLFSRLPQDRRQDWHSLLEPGGFAALGLLLLLAALGALAGIRREETL